MNEREILPLFFCIDFLHHLAGDCTPKRDEVLPSNRTGMHSSVPLPAAACSRDGSQRLQEWLVHLFRVEAEPGRVSFHDGNASNEVFAALPLLLEFCCKVTNSIRVELLLDGRARKPHILSLALFGCIYLPVEGIFVKGGGADAKRRCHASYIEGTLFWWMCLREGELVA